MATHRRQARGRVLLRSDVSEPPGTANSFRSKACRIASPASSRRWTDCWPCTSGSQRVATDRWTSGEAVQVRGSIGFRVDRCWNAGSNPLQRSTALGPGRTRPSGETSRHHASAAPACVGTRQMATAYRPGFGWRQIRRALRAGENTPYQDRGSFAHDELAGTMLLTPGRPCRKLPPDDAVKAAATPMSARSPGQSSSTLIHLCSLLRWCPCSRPSAIRSSICSPAAGSWARSSSSSWQRSSGNDLPLPVDHPNDPPDP